MSIGKLIGNTPMIKINYEFKGKKDSVYTKLEYYNYSGSIKDRIALYIIETSRKNGHGLGMWIVNNSIQYTGGTVVSIDGNNGFEFMFTLRSEE